MSAQHAAGAAHSVENETQGAAASAAWQYPFVDERDLASVAASNTPMYYAPRDTQDPQRAKLAAMITFITMVIALWGIVSFAGSMSKTLSSVSNGAKTIEQQLIEANAGLIDLDKKTGHLHQMAGDSKTLGKRLAALDKEMGVMLSGVDKIAVSMNQMDGSLSTLNSELGKMNKANDSVASTLGVINTGLAQQRRSVQSMSKSVSGTQSVLSTLPGRMNATNGRLGHINSVLNLMGCQGMVSDLNVRISVGPIPNGSAEIRATIVPPGAWGKRADGAPCQ